MLRRNYGSLQTDFLDARRLYANASNIGGGNLGDLLRAGHFGQNTNYLTKAAQGPAFDLALGQL